MKKFRLLALLALVLTVLCGSASAASLVSGGPDGQVYIASVADSTGYITTLTDGSTATTWTKTQSAYGADLTINLYSATVGEIWIRSGHCYSQNYYNHYDRPDVIAVTLWYPVNRYSESSVTYRYRMSDVFRPNTSSASWNNGYQRLLLPQAYSGVTRIELTIESSIQGYGRTGATITDILVCQGQHTTATPRAYATSTPKPYVEYITPTPTPYTPWITPTPNSQVTLLTPTPTRHVSVITPTPTAPLVELITPVPLTPTPSPTPAQSLPTEDYPSAGIPARLLKSAATRSGPDNRFDEPGSFFSKGTYVNVVSKSWDESAGVWWYQIEFSYRGEWMRVYTPANRVDLDSSLVPTENMDGEPREVLVDCDVYFGPGYEYRVYSNRQLGAGKRAVVYAIEDGWAQVEYHDYAIDLDRRGWIPVDCLSTYPYPW